MGAKLQLKYGEIALIAVAMVVFSFLSGARIIVLLGFCGQR